MSNDIVFNEDETQGCLPKQYKKKPVTIESVLFTGENGEAVALWCGGKSIYQEGWEKFVEIPTLEGTMTAKAGDYIIKGVQGEFYPCKPDIFEATYEAVAWPYLMI